MSGPAEAGQPGAPESPSRSADAAPDGDAAPELHAAPDVHAAPDIRWAPASAPLPRSAGWALFFGIAGLVLSLLVGWGFLIGLFGVGLAVAALRRPWESRPLAVWALCLSLVSLVYSAGWLWWASTQGPLVG